MGSNITEEKIKKMQAFLKLHKPDPKYDEEDCYDGKLPDIEFAARMYYDILEELGRLPEGL